MKPAVIAAAFLLLVPSFAHAQPPAPWGGDRDRGEDRGDRGDRGDRDRGDRGDRGDRDDRGMRGGFDRDFRNRGFRDRDDFRWRGVWLGAGGPAWCWDQWGRFRWDDWRCRQFWQQQRWRWGNSWGWGWSR
jgi:hypothetical protein